MARACTICEHPERAAIEEAIVQRVANRRIASQYATSEATIRRHASNHIVESIKQSQEAKEEARGLDVVRQLQAINTITMAILNESRKAKKNGMALFAIDRLQKQLELQAKLLGTIDTTQVNIYVSPEWQIIRAVLVQALQPFPDARVAVASALVRLEENHVSLN